MSPPIMPMTPAAIQCITELWAVFAVALLVDLAMGYTPAECHRRAAVAARARLAGAWMAVAS